MYDNAWLIDKLVCPDCGPRAPLRPHDHVLDCAHCGVRWPRPGGIPDLAGPVAPPRLFSTQWAMELGPLVSIYERYWRPAITRPFSDAGWELRTASDYLVLAPGHDWLDLACGPGNFTRALAATARPGRVVGADLSWPMLRRGARELGSGTYPDVALVRADVTRWPFADASFDRVHCAGALHLFPARDAVFRAIRASLKPGGIFVCATYCRSDNALKRQVQAHVSRAHGFHWFTPDELQGLAADAGFAGWEAARLRDGIVFRVRRP